MFNGRTAWVEIVYTDPHALQSGQPKSTRNDKWATKGFTYG